MHDIARVLVAVGLSVGLGGAVARAQDVLTQHNDSWRSGLNAQETELTPSTVQAGFGKLFTRPVVGTVYAQILHKSDVAITGKGTYDVAYVATMHNLVYAFDADGTEEAPLWGPVSLGPPIPLPDLCIGPNNGFQTYYHDIAQEVGIVSTPVISAERNALYAVAITKQGTTYSYVLARIDIRSGALTTNSFASSTCTQALAGGSSDFPPSGFEVNRQNQRPGLLLSGDTIYVGFAAFGDESPWQGWIFGFDADTLQPIQSDGGPAAYKTSNSGAGVWMSGNGLAADEEGNVYFNTGNGTFDAQSSLGESLIKLSPTLDLLDWFAPCDVQCLNSSDLDLSSGGVLLLPEASGGQNLVVTGGKEGKLYLLDRDQFGTSDQHFTCTDSQILQTLCPAGPGGCGQCCTSCGSSCSSGTSCFCDSGTSPSRPTCTARGHIRASPVTWTNSEGTYVYVWPQNVGAQAYSLVDAQLSTTPTSENSLQAQYPGGLLSLSANGEDATSGVLWATLAVGNSNQIVVPGVLTAWDAGDLTTSLWNSAQDPADYLGNFPKFPPPTIADGKVYVGTAGLLQDSPSLEVTPTQAPSVANLVDDLLGAAWTTSGGTVQLACTATPFEWVYGGGDFGDLDLNPISPTGGSSTVGPALSADGSRFYLAWVDSSQTIRLATTSDCQTLSDPWAVPGASTSYSPALAYDGDQLFLAWTDTAGVLQVARSTDEGQTFNVTSTSIAGEGAPSLAAIDNVLTVLFVGNDGRGTLNAIQSQDGGSTFGPVIGLGITGSAAPSLTRLEAYELLWSDSNGVLNHALTDASLSRLENTVVYGTTNRSRPSTVVYQDLVWAGWSGTENNQGAFVHVAPWQSPALVVYGQKGEGN